MSEPAAYGEVSQGRQTVIAAKNAKTSPRADNVASDVMKRLKKRG